MPMASVMQQNKALSVYVQQLQAGSRKMQPLPLTSHNQGVGKCHNLPCLQTLAGQAEKMTIHTCPPQPASGGALQPPTLWLQQVLPPITPASPRKVVRGCCVQVHLPVLDEHVESATKAPPALLSPWGVSTVPYPSSQFPRSGNKFPSHIIQALFKLLTFLWVLW